MRRSIRVIAVLEAAKGTLVLLAGFGMLGLIHRDVQGLAEDLVRYFYLNPAARVPRIFVGLAANVNDSTLWLLACAALSYAALRLLEAFGLWHQRRWAEWVGAASGALYVPVEVYELLRRVSWQNVTLLAVNTAFLICLARALRSRPMNSPKTSTLRIDP